MVECLSPRLVGTNATDHPQASSSPFGALKTALRCQHDPLPCKQVLPHDPRGEGGSERYGSGLSVAQPKRPPAMLPGWAAKRTTTDSLPFVNSTGIT